MEYKLIDLIYPRRCPVCEKVLAPKDGYVHEECRQKLEFITEPFCMKCGKPVESMEQEYCYDCTVKKFHYVKGFPCIKYDQRMSRSIAAFKYKGKKEYSHFYVDELLKRYEQLWKTMRFDLLIPIPIHQSKMKERGFNQAELIAKGISEIIKVPVESNLLLRNRKTMPQKELNDKERLRNLEEAFEVDRKYLRHPCQRVLLVDDIYTTGSTIEACTKRLLSCGIPEVYYTSVCIGQGY